MEDDSSVLVSLSFTTGQGIAEICDGRKDLYLVETLYTKLNRRFTTQVSHRTQGQETTRGRTGTTTRLLEEIRLCGPRSFSIRRSSLLP